MTEYRLVSVEVLKSYMVSLFKRDDVIRSADGLSEQQAKALIGIHVGLNSSGLTGGITAFCVRRDEAEILRNAFPATFAPKEEPARWKRTGEYREPKEGETFEHYECGWVCVERGDMKDYGECWILTKVNA